MPRKKYGTAWKKVDVGSSPSSQEPRRQPSAMPSRVPTTKLITVHTPSSPMVHGSVWPSTVLTGADSVIDWPRLPWNSWPQ